MTTNTKSREIRLAPRPQGLPIARLPRRLSRPCFFAGAHDQGRDPQVSEVERERVFLLEPKSFIPEQRDTLKNSRVVFSLK